MIKYFSVDWLAQSHHNTALTEEHETGRGNVQTCRPHIPCMVQPRPPTFGRSRLQTKTKQSKPVEPVESSGHQDSSPCSFFHPTSCASPETSGYSSGYESEAAPSECLSVDVRSKVGKEGPQRRVRTKFTPEQISKLENIFSKHRYLDAGERLKTAQKLKLTETQVRSWFQNRRMKLKREMQDYFAPQVPAVMFQPLPAVQYHMSAQRAPCPATSPALYPLPVPHMGLQRHIPPPHPAYPIIHNQHFY